MELSTLEIVSIGVLFVAVALLYLVVRPALAGNKEQLKDAYQSIPPFVLDTLTHATNRAIGLAEKHVTATPTKVDDELLSLLRGAMIDVLLETGILEEDEPTPPAEG